MSTKKKKTDSPPFETFELRRSLKAFFRSPFRMSNAEERPIGSFRWGVYLFYDYDGEPIYVGQTYEKVSGRIGRHLTNQRTDAVAMSVLDPFEVREIEVFPLPEYDLVDSKHSGFTNAKIHLNALEYEVYKTAIELSRFGAILNEQDPLTPVRRVALPPSFRKVVISDEVEKLRAHADVRIARRAQVISRLAQTISERQVDVGLRRTLATQALRLQALAEQRFKELGGDSAVEEAPENEDENSEEQDSQPEGSQT